MLTFSATKGAAVVCVGAKKSILVFPKGEINANDLSLISSPEEETHEGVISWPGEYDYDGVTIRGIGHDEGQQVSFVTRIDGVCVAFLSSPVKEWSDYEIELLGDVDVLVVPSEKPKILQKIIDEVDPRVLILRLSGDKKVDEEAIAVCGAQDAEPVSELKLKGSLPAEGRQIVILKG